MRRWALLTVVLYVVVVTVLTLPIAFFLGDGEEELAIAFLWILPVLVVIQVALLLIPAGTAGGRPIPRREVTISAAMGALPMAVMLTLFIAFVTLMVLGESDADPFIYGWPILATVVALWITWGVIFYRRYTAEDPRALTNYITSWLLRGSILELLVAIPSHIISRQRDECCAPAFTLLGLMTGLAIALLSFGPGIFFLFAERIRNKRRASA